MQKGEYFMFPCFGVQRSVNNVFWYSVQHYANLLLHFSCIQFTFLIAQGEIQRISGKEMFPKLAALTDEFTQTQYEAAKLFEITYHSISNFPELAEVVRYSNTIQIIIGLCRGYEIWG